MPRAFIAEQHDELIGSLVLLFSRGTTARLYPSPSPRRPVARGRTCIRGSAPRPRYGARTGTDAAGDPQGQPIFDRYVSRPLGYWRFGSPSGYYADQMDAWRYEKAPDNRLKPRLERVPWYEQTLEFTCGPACPIMAMQTLDPTMQPQPQP